MEYFVDCIDEIKEKIDSQKNEMNGEIPYLDELTLEGYKTSIQMCLRELSTGLLKWAGKVDFEDLEATRKRYHEIKEELGKIVGENLKFPKTDKVFESPIVVMATDVKEIEKISNQLLRP